MQPNCKQILLSVNCFSQNNSTIARIDYGGGYFCSITKCIKRLYAKIAQQFLANRAHLLHFCLFGIYFSFSAVGAILTRKSHRARTSQAAVFRSIPPHRPLFCVCVGWWSQKFPLKHAINNGDGDRSIRLIELPETAFHLISLLNLRNSYFLFFCPW